MLCLCQNKKAFQSKTNCLYPLPLDAMESGFSTSLPILPGRRGSSSSCRAISHDAVGQDTITSPMVIDMTVNITFLQPSDVSGNNIKNKKVLLRERKRHTARRVASTPYVVLTGSPPGQGTPQPGYPPSQGTPPARVPPSRLDLAGYPPRLPHGILGNVAKHYGIWVPPLWTDRQTRVKTLPSLVLRTRAVINLRGQGNAGNFIFIRMWQS